MGTVIRAEVSKENPYYISKHRYYELKHFCLQYKEFKKIYNNLCDKIPGGIIQLNQDEKSAKDVSFYVRERYLNNINLIEESAKLADPVLGQYVMKGVTEGLSYSYFRMNENIPCCKDLYYECYRKFFFILDKKQNALYYSLQDI